MADGFGDYFWFRRFGLGSSSSDIQKLGRGLLQVKERSSFERFVARLVATQMDAGQLKRINEAFRTFDLDKDGSLSRDELVRGLTTLGASAEEAQQVMEELDVGRTGRISYTEFLAGVTDLRQRSPMERDKLLKLAWQQFAPDQRGMVKTGSIQAALAARGLTVAELPKEFLKELRRGSAGEISFEAFRGLFAGDESCCVMNSFSLAAAIREVGQLEFGTSMGHACTSGYVSEHPLSCACTDGGLCHGCITHDEVIVGTDDPMRGVLRFRASGSHALPEEFRTRMDRRSHLGICSLGSVVMTVPCDLMDFNSVRQAAAKVQSVVGSQGLDVLALNAGVMALNDIRTSEGFEIQMHTNQLSHVLLLSKLMPQLEACANKKGDARVVFHSSSARDFPSCDLDASYFKKSEPGTLGGDHQWMMSEVAGLCGGPWHRYHMTKLANAAYAMKLHEVLAARGSKVKSMAVDPGASVTELQRTSVVQGNMSNCIANLMMSGSSSQSAADGSTPLIIACFGPEAESGDFYMPEQGAVTGSLRRTGLSVHYQFTHGSCLVRSKM
eukprot:s4509_g1.t1